MKIISTKIVVWALGEDTGMSSKAICRFMLGITGDYPPPSDADDRGRCIRLLNLIPEWWDRLDEMAEIPGTKVIVWSDGLDGVVERGWKEQIPLIKKEKLTQQTL